MSSVDNQQDFERLHGQTLGDLAFKRIETAIVRGDLPPGSRISEVDLARKFGISRGPLREALRRLEGRKLLRRIPHVGVSVVGLSREDFLEIFFVREALEGMACRLAAARMPDAEIVELEAVLERHRRNEQLRSGSAYYQEAGDLDFHYRVACASGNAKLVELLCDELYHLIRVYRYRSGSAPGRAQQAFEEHRLILDAIRARDADRAEALMRGHIARARQILEATPPDRPAAPPPGAMAATGAGRSESRSPRGPEP